EKLHRLPGFARTADRLMGEAMARRSRAASSYAEVMTADRMLRKLSDGAPLADALQAEYWQRRAVDAMHAGRRDEALLLAVRAAGTDSVEAREIAAELIGNDYRRLAASYRLPTPPSRWGIDWARHSLTVVDSAHRAQRLALGEHPATEGLEPVRVPGGLTALQHVPITREISVDDKGSAGAFRLTLRVQHSGANDLLVTLTAPSGASVSLPLEQQSPGQELYSFSATGSSPLVQLSDEARQGVWRFAIVDREPGGVGVLLRWGLRFSDAGTEWRDSPEQGVAIPDPVRTEQVRVTLSPDGRRAVAEPARAGAVGELAVWDLETGMLVRDLHVQGVPDRLQFNPDASRLLVQTGDRLTIWDVASGKAVANLATQSGFVLPPALSVGGDFLVIAERVDGARPLFSLVRVADGELVASSAGVAGAKDWVLGPQARYLALLETTRVVAVVDPRRGKMLRELRHDRDVRRLIPAPAGDLLLTVDARGDVRAWRLPAEGAAPAADSWRLGVTLDPESVSISADGSTVAFEGPDGQVVVRDVNGDLKPVYLRIDRNDRPVATGLSPDGAALVTVNGKLFRLWRLEPRELGGGPDLNLSALALDHDGALAVLGFRGGHVRVRSATELARAAPSETVDYIGHHGSVTSLDVNVQQNLIASGGEDGVVRVWDLATVAPAPRFMRHPVGPVRAVRLSPDGRWVASAADYSARAWNVADGTLTAELPVNGTALAVDIAPDSMHWAVGDSAGNVFFGKADGAAPLGSVRAQGPVDAIAFGPDGALLASGDETGTVEIWDTRRFEAEGERHGFPNPVRWVGWSADGRHLLIQTDQWLHRAELVNGDMRVVDSRLLDVGIEAGAALETPDGGRLRLIGGRGTGHLALIDLDLSAPAAQPLPTESPLLARDWSAALGLRIDESGQVR
ncbi:MAG TPA: proprotein convertase P-domain-containing protein, partial [Gammaproteobacteria bacterium]|nr:proprotein convertase P-domain-containing protein [Gammaproteobacteria bacterium]